MAVDMALAVLLGEAEIHTGFFLNGSSNFLECLFDLLERELVAEKREVQILGKAILPEMTAPEGGATLECQSGATTLFRKARLDLGGT